MRWLLCGWTGRRAFVYLYHVYIWPGVLRTELGKEESLDDFMVIWMIPRSFLLLPVMLHC